MREIRNRKNRRENNQFSTPNFILIFTSCLCLGLYPNRAITATPNLAPSQQVILSPGLIGTQVQVLQVQLKALGYYNDLIDGQYGLSTKNAVAQFQKAKGAKREDGIADLTTQIMLKTALSGQTKCKTVPAPAAAPTPQLITKSQPKNHNFIWWSLLGLGILGSVGAIFYLIKRFGQVPRILESVTLENSNQKLLNPSYQNKNSEQKLLNPSHHNTANFFFKAAQTAKLQQQSSELLQPETTAILPKLKIVDELIKDLRSPDVTKQRKAIWNLSQQGDSRAVQPLVNLMIDADSQQHGLILSALAEIGTRTLKPMNRALAISIQNESPQVRQNAIRDLVRIYDMMGQMSQVLRHALEDPDPEVQATAKYALNNMNRIRNIATIDQQILTDMSAEDPN